MENQNNDDENNAIYEYQYISQVSLQQNAKDLIINLLKLECNTNVCEYVNQLKDKNDAYQQLFRSQDQLKLYETQVNESLLKIEEIDQEDSCQIIKNKTDQKQSISYVKINGSNKSFISNPIDNNDEESIENMKKFLKGEMEEHEQAMAMKTTLLTQQSKELDKLEQQQTNYDQILWVMREEGQAIEARMKQQETEMIKLTDAIKQGCNANDRSFDSGLQIDIQRQKREDCLMQEQQLNKELKLKNDALLQELMRREEQMRKLQEEHEESEKKLLIQIRQLNSAHRPVSPFSICNSQKSKQSNQSRYSQSNNLNLKFNTSTRMCQCRHNGLNNNLNNMSRFPSDMHSEMTKCFNMDSPYFNLPTSQKMQARYRRSFQQNQNSNKNNKPFAATTDTKVQNQQEQLNSQQDQDQNLNPCPTRRNFTMGSNSNENECNKENINIIINQALLNKLNNAEHFSPARLESLQQSLLDTVQINVMMQHYDKNSLLMHYKESALIQPPQMIGEAESQKEKIHKQSNNNQKKGFSKKCNQYNSNVSPQKSMSKKPFNFLCCNCTHV